MAEVSKLDKLLRDAANHATRSQRVDFSGMLDEIDELGNSCCHFCCCCCCRIPSNGGTSDLCKRQRGEDSYVGRCDGDGDAENDFNPQYQFFLKHLKPYKTSYLLEYKKQGVGKIIKYHVDESLLAQSEEKKMRVARTRMKSNDEPHVDSPIMKMQKKSSQFAPTAEKDEEAAGEKTRRVARSCMKRRDEPPIESATVKKQKKSSQSPPTAEKENLTRPSSFSKKTRPMSLKKFKIENIDPEYLFFLDKCSVSDSFLLFNHDHGITVYEKLSHEFDQRKDEHSDSGSSDVEILETSSLFKERESIPTTVQGADKTSKFKVSSTQAEFRRQVSDVLVKPYDEEEYRNLWHDIQVRKPSERHFDFRHGRDKSCSLSVIGKSYLDHQQDLKSMLSRFENDKAMCLSLLRGFFFWLQNCVQEGSFPPWKDKECLAVKPRRLPR